MNLNKRAANQAASVIPSHQAFINDTKKGKTSHLVTFAKTAKDLKNLLFASNAVLSLPERLRGGRCRLEDIKEEAEKRISPSAGDEVLEITNNLLETTKQEIEQTRDNALKEDLHNGVDNIESSTND